MEFTEAGVLLSFEVTFDEPALPVAMKVFDDTGVSPSLVSTTAMLNFFGNSYRAHFTPTAGKTYLIHKAVYTDGTFTTLDTDYAAGTESVRADDIAGILLNALINSYQMAGSVGQAILTASLAASHESVNLEGQLTVSDVITGQMMNAENVLGGEIVGPDLLAGLVVSPQQDLLGEIVSFVVLSGETIDPHETISGNLTTPILINGQILECP